MVRVFAIAVAILLLAVALSWAQNVDVVSQVAQSRLIVNGPLSQVIDSVVTLGEFAFITSGTPLAVFAVNVTQMRTRAPAATVRNVTIAQDSSPSGVAVGDSVFFFGFQNIYRLNVSQAIADPLYRFNASRDVSTLKYERQAGQNPIPTRAFTASVSGTTYAYFIGSVLNENTNLREIIRVEPAKFDQGINNATAVISINVAAQSFVDAVYGSSHAALLFSGDEGSNQTIVALFNPATAVVGATPSPIARTVTIGDLEVAGRPMAFDESRNVLYIAGQRPSDGGQPYLYKINLNITTTSAVYSATDGTGGVTATKLGDLFEEVKAVNIDPVSGVVFVALYDGLAAGSVVRVNPVSMELNEPAVFFSQGRQIPAFALVDPSTRFLLVGLELDFVSFRYPTVCPSQCFEYFGQDNVNFPRQGQCISSACVCAPGFHGDACDQRDCSSDCGGPARGTCNNGRCICESRWTGANCTVEQCPNNCTGNGICETNPANGTLTCKCTNAQFRGEDCSLLSYQICPSFSALDQCVGAPGCGWCVDTSSCGIGNQVGPANGTCQEWLVGNSREIGTFVVAIIFIIIFGVMVVLNVASAVSVDHQTTNYLEEENLVTIPFLKQIYWRDERSAKAWKLFDQLQFISYFSLIGVAFPTRLIGFTRYFNWAMLLLPLPFAPRNDPFFPERDIGRASASPSASGAPSAAIAGAGVFGSSRSLLNFEQLSSTLGFGDLSRPFYAVMFWFIILLAILLVVYVIFALISWLAFNGKAEDPQKFRKTYAVVLRQKVFYILTRVILIGYMPINITAAYHLKSSSDGSGGVRAASAICIIVFGILPIVFNAFVVWGKTKELLFLYLKLRFGALYSVYHYEKARFNLVVLARKFLIAILIGFLATNRDNDPLVYAQVFVIIAIIIVYLIVLFIVRPYLDQVHLLLDAGINILNGIAWGIALLCIDTAQPAGTFNRGASSSPVAEIIAAICVLLSFAICCVAYCHSWYNMEGDTSLLVLCRGSKNKPGESIHDGGDDDDESGDEENAVPMKPSKQPEPESESSSDDLASDSEDEKPKSAKAALPPPPPAEEDSSSESQSDEEEDVGDKDESSSQEASSSQKASSSEEQSSEEQSSEDGSSDQS